MSEPIHPFDVERFRTERLKHESNHYKSLRWPRLMAHALFGLFIPFFLPIHLSIYLYVCVTKKSSSPFIRAYLKRYFKFYFWFSGLFVLRVFPPPQTLNGPAIIFTVRNADLITPFLDTQFSFPVELPYSADLSKLPLHLFLPFIRFGSFVASYGYLDQALHEALPAIRNYLESGKSVVIFINPDYLAPSSQNKLQIYFDSLELLDTSIPCYFMSCRGLEYHRSGTLLRPTQVNLLCVSQDDLFEGIADTPLKRAKQCARIQNFFQFKSAEII